MTTTIYYDLIKEAGTDGTTHNLTIPIKYRRKNDYFWTDNGTDYNAQPGKI